MAIIKRLRSGGGSSRNKIEHFILMEKKALRVKSSAFKVVSNYTVVGVFCEDCVCYVLNGSDFCVRAGVKICSKSLTKL